MSLPPSGEVSLTLWYTIGGTRQSYASISHIAGNWRRVRLLLPGGAGYVFLNREQVADLLMQWRRLTRGTSWADGWTIDRSYFEVHVGAD